MFHPKSQLRLVEQLLAHIDRQRVGNQSRTTMFHPRWRLRLVELFGSSQVQQAPHVLTE